MHVQFFARLCLVFGLTAALDLQAVDGEEPFAFSEEALLLKYDNNRNGELDQREKRRLVDDYGFDVPMLPSETSDYVTVQIPEYVDSDELAGTDNTPENNPLTDAGATLGRVLFYDRQLSRNSTIACASCHLQENAFADPRRRSVGYQGGLTNRNAMNLANLRFTNLQDHQPGFFWDERAPTLEAQALMPIQDTVEMGMTLDALERRTQELPYYPTLFDAAFGSSEATSDRVAKAIAQFMRSMLSFDSKFDQAASAHRDVSSDFDLFTEQENLGKSLFINGVKGIAEHGCAHCHIPPTFGMTKSQNNGLDLEYKDKGLGARDQPRNDPFTPSNNGKFKAPSLRNVALTAPYMHDGRFESLAQVLDHYSNGVHPHENLGLAFPDQDNFNTTSGLALTNQEKVAIIAFLKTLTDQAFITDPRFSDPFIRRDRQ